MFDETKDLERRDEEDEQYQLALDRLDREREEFEEEMQRLIDEAYPE